MEGEHPSLRSGSVVYISRSASVQFVAGGFNFRIIKVQDWDTYQGWVWLDGYQLDRHGVAVERRSVFVQRSGLRAPKPIVAERQSQRNAGTRAIP